MEKFIKNFCTCSEWRKSDFNGLAFRENTPCFIDVVILSVIYLFFLVFCSMRLYQLLNRRNEKCRLRSRIIHIFKILLAIVTMSTALLQLNIKLGNSAKNPYGQGTSPSEITEFVMSACGWLYMTIIFCIECRATVANFGLWISRFLVLFALAGHIIKLDFLIVFYRHNNVSYDYFFYLYLVHFASIGLQSLISLLYWPRSSSYVIVAYKLVPLNDPADIELKLKEASACPESSASWVSLLFFNWMNKLIRQGYKKPLQDDDVWQLADYDTSVVTHSRLDKHWQRELAVSRISRQSRKSQRDTSVQANDSETKGKKTTVKKASLTRALYRTFGLRFAFGGLVKLLNDGSQFVGPMLLSTIITFVKNADSGEPTYYGYLYALAIFGGQFVGAIAECQYFQIVMRVGMQVRSAVTLAVFRKSTSLTHESRRNQSSGRIVNLVSADAENLMNVCQGLHTLWSSPLRIIVSIYLLYRIVKWAAFIGLAVLILMMPVQKVIMGASARLLRSALKQTDERVKLVNEVMTSMNVVKSYAWEDSLSDRIMEVRNVELGWLTKSLILRSINFSLISVIPILVTVFTFTAFVAAGNVLDAETAFTALSLFSVLQMPLFLLPQVIANFVSARVAINRLEEFLTGDDMDLSKRLAPAPHGAAAILMKNASYCWDCVQEEEEEEENKQSNGPTLSNIVLEVPSGELLAVIGSTGSGKSSLLSAILGEIPIESSSTSTPVTVRGSIAYVSQQAWIFNATLRENILFGRPYDRERYAEIIRVCSLERDISLMTGGDATEIGEKGVNLSGGQKQRVSLARAVYADADVYLFDDPLSALDSHVAKEIYENCLCGRLASKTRVFCTNRLEFVSSCDRVLLFDQGSIVAVGTYAEMLESEPLFVELMQDQAPVDGETEESITDSSETTKNDTALTETKGDGDGDGVLAAAALIKDEEREVGGVSMDVIRGYISAIGGIHWAILVGMLYILTEACRIGASYWIKILTTVTEDSKDEVSAKNNSSHGMTYYIGIYAALSVVQSIFQLGNLLTISLAGLRGGRRLHDNMFMCMLRAPMSFFNCTPIGRIINRFSKDMRDVDTNIVTAISVFLRGVIQILGTLIVIGITTPYTLSIFVPVFALFYWAWRYFQMTARELKRLDSIFRSPIYAYFAQCLGGLGTIRAFRAHEQVCDESASKIDSQTRFWFASFSANRWLAVRLELLGGLIVFGSAVFIVAMRHVIEPAAAGLALSYALSITSLLNMSVRLAALAENSFNAVERVLQYSVIEPEEPDGTNAKLPPPPHWPERGAIEFKNVSMKYREDLPEVLSDLSFSVHSHEKIGIVGRTGAGKSTTFLTLFRIFEPSSGQIIIDGVPTHTLNLTDLRRALSIIPQDPVLFTGTIRFNLSPFGELEDSLLWNALKRAHLYKYIQSLPDKLDTLVAENGENFSVGQRQLLCLARALIRRSSILVLDEATAAVDVATDVLIQKTIRKEFADCTVLTIAHRLSTIIDADKILVLDAGRKVEFGTPKELLDHEGIFSAMIDDMGATTGRFLRSVASGESDIDTLHEIPVIEECKEAPTPKMPFLADRNLSQISILRYSRPLLEEVRGAFLTIKSALEEINASQWQSELARANIPRNQWIAQLRRLLLQLTALTEEEMHNVNEQDLYLNSTDGQISVIDAYRRST